jgi:hypothetical protein
MTYVFFKTGVKVTLILYRNKNYLMLYNTKTGP